MMNGRRINVEKYDCLILGTGTAGAKIAKEFVKRDLTVAMIEKDFDVFGGACINTACIPTKVLIEDSNHGYSYEEAFARKNEIVPWFQGSKYKSLSREENITLYEGHASFIADDVVEVVTKEGTLEMSGTHIVINTGSVAHLPSIPDIEQAQQVFTSTAMLEQEKLPGEILIVGGGYIGLEFASMYANFGSHVTVILRRKRLLTDEDPDIVEEIEKVLTEKGITFMYETDIDQIKDKDGKVYVHTNREEVLTGDALLYAIGRKPNTTDLKLQN